jgi:hypothetical protein
MLVALDSGAPPPARSLVNHHPSLLPSPRSLEGKARFLAHAARCLRPGGAFVLVDIFLRQGEERGPFVARFRAYMQEAVDAGAFSSLLLPN